MATYKIKNFDFMHTLRLNRGLVFGVIIITALLAFEIFNYGTTDYALTDLLGDLSFMGVHWATILAIAFCGIDFAGIARLFSPESGAKTHNETWYLFGAWLLAATMNAMLTWWGITLAILDNAEAGNAVVQRETVLLIAPIFVAILVWLIRVLIIGTFSVAGDRLFTMSDAQHRQARQVNAIPSGRVSTPTMRSPTNSARITPVTPTTARPATATANHPASRSISASPRNSPASPPPEPADFPELEYTPFDFTTQVVKKPSSRGPVPAIIPGEARNPRSSAARQLT